MTETLDFRELDPLFAEEVAQEPGCQHLRRCFSCGVCTAACPVSAIEPGFSPALIIRQVFYGMRAALLSSAALWYCARCARCSFQCPQDVRFLDIIQGLRNIAVREGCVSLERVAQLAQAEEAIQDLRRRLLAAIQENAGPPEEMATLLRRLVADPEPA
jgi:heterodisulfide reductase subunit C